MLPSTVPGADEGEVAGNPDVAVDLARAIVGLSFDRLDERTIAATKRLTLDVLGAGIAGIFEPGSVEVRDLVIEWGGKPEATLIQSGARIPAHHTVAVHGAACRALELDDVHELASIHTTATVVPVAFAAAEAQPQPVSGQELVTAIAAGVDLACRLSLAPRHTLAASGKKPHGMSYTYQLGTFAAAATWAKIAGADTRTMLHSLGMAYSQAAGNQQCLLDGALAVRVQQGLSACNGVMAARLALRGITGPTHPLEGRFGYYPMYCDGDYDRAAIVEGLGDHLEIANVTIKPYPSCSWTHTAIAAAGDAHNHPSFSPDRIRQVLLIVKDTQYVRTVTEPMEAKQRPRTPVDAQFSMPYCVAVALCRGQVVLDDFLPPALDDPDVLRVASLIEKQVIPTEVGGSRRLPTPAGVEVRLDDGAVIRTSAEYGPGHPMRPMSWDEVVAKFRRSIAFPQKPLPAQAADALIEQIETLDSQPDVRSLIRDLLVW